MNAPHMQAQLLYSLFLFTGININCVYLLEYVS